MLGYKGSGASKTYYIRLPTGSETTVTGLFRPSSVNASHVVVGMAFLLLVMFVSLLGCPIHTQERRVKFLSWYWHFVDAVWGVVFTVVYVLGR